MKRTSLQRSLIILGGIFLVLAGGVLAQLELSETFISEDGTWGFNYPEGWGVEVDEGLVFVDGEGAFLLVFGPEIIENIGLEDAKDLNALLTELAPLLEYEVTEFNTGETEDGRAFSVTDLVSEDQQFATLGFALNFSDGRQGVIFAELQEDTDLVFDTIIQMVLSFDAVDGSAEPTGDMLTSLEQHDSEWQDAVEELESAGLIGSGGELVFFEDLAFFEGQGRFFTALARNSPRTDVVMAGELTYTASDATSLESCTLLTRIVTDSTGTAEEFLQVGLTNQDAVLFLDRFGTGDDDIMGDLLPVSLDLDEPNHFLMLAIDDTLSVYLNGELILDQFPVEDRSGTYGIALSGEGAGARCEGRNIWVYEAPVFEPGLCEISAANQVNTRTEPTTSAERGEALEPGTIEEAIGQTEGEDGFIWWQIGENRWVREDVVRARGDCADIPAVTPGK